MSIGIEYSLPPPSLPSEPSRRCCRGEKGIYLGSFLCYPGVGRNKEANEDDGDSDGDEVSEQGRSGSSDRSTEFELDSRATSGGRQRENCLSRREDSALAPPPGLLPCRKGEAIRKKFAHRSKGAGGSVEMRTRRKRCALIGRRIFMHPRLPVYHPRLREIYLTGDIRVTVKLHFTPITITRSVIADRIRFTRSRAITRNPYLGILHFVTFNYDFA